MIARLVHVIRLALEDGQIATKFGLEGPLRYALRAYLCRQGYGWTAADTLAKDMVDAALKKLNAVRPSWNEGQLEWTIHAGTLIERTHCKRCHKPLPEGHHKFCSNLCAGQHNGRIYRLMEMNENQAVRTAIRWI